MSQEMPDRRPATSRRGRRPLACVALAISTGLALGCGEKRAEPAAAATPELLRALSKDAAALAEGRNIWRTTCTSCHLESGGGSIGPNLTDAFWLHGGTPEAIYRTIKDGVPARGMTAWGPVLGEGRVRAVTAYVMSIQNTNVAGGKAPQGDREGS